jgi:hypothetical protein
MAAIWLVAVAGVSATAWVAIDRAGRDLTSASVASLAPAPLNTPTQGATPTKTRAKPKPTATATTPSPLAKMPSPTPDPAPGHTAPATAQPVATPRASHTRAPEVSAQPSPPAQPTPQDKSISVNGGLISVRCTGDVIALRVAQPDNQWRVLVDTSQQGQISVTFTGGEEEDQQRTQVMAVCTNGAPAFSSPNN